VVPTPMENIVLLPFFGKMGFLWRLKPCNIVALHFAQKRV
jgi:hypothetical protein